MTLKKQFRRWLQYAVAGVLSIAFSVNSTDVMADYHNSEVGDYSTSWPEGMTDAHGKVPSGRQDKRYVWVDKDREAIDLYDYLDQDTLFSKDDTVENEAIDLDSAMELCLKENKNSCYNAGHVFMKEFNVTHRGLLLERAVELFQRSCSLGRHDACYRLGKAINVAESRVIDLRQVLHTSNVRAVKIHAFTRATSISDPEIRGDAYKCLAESFLDKAKERNLAYTNASKGCELGNPDACYLQGITLWLCNVEDYIVPKCRNERERRSVMLHAFEEGTKASNPEYRSNSWYFLGYELDQRRAYGKALAAFEKGCELNNENACFFSGIAYEDAKGTRRNMKKALHYYQKACSLDGKYGCDRLQRLAVPNYSEKDRTLDSRY